MIRRKRGRVTAEEQRAFDKLLAMVLGFTIGSTLLIHIITMLAEAIA